MRHRTQEGRAGEGARSAPLAARQAKFIDLFAGIGGFHVGMVEAGAECVYACEIDPDLRGLYERNYGICPDGDIRLVDADDIPSHQIACAGFPCVSYSVAGSRLGQDCPRWGGLVNDALDLIFSVRSEAVLLENVEGLARLGGGKALEAIMARMKGEGYATDYRILSPDQFGIPQHRKRIYIVADRNGLESFQWPDPDDYTRSPGGRFLDERPTDARPLEKPKEEVLDMWRQLLERISPVECGAGLRGVIFAAECGATYPYDINFLKEPVKILRRYRGAFGVDLSDCPTRRAVMERLPPYVSNCAGGRLPRWKKSAIRDSRGIFTGCQSKISGDWAGKMKSFGRNSWQRLEWRSDMGKLDLWDNIIQFRPSGIRISKKNRLPCLTAMSMTQTPILGWEKRYISGREALKLQGIEGLAYGDSESRIIRAAGNAANAHIVYSIANEMMVGQGRGGG